MPSREDALEGLWATFDAELERLIPIRAKLWESEDEPALLEKIDAVAFDGSKKGVLRRRYESANHLDMHRCLKQFTEQRRLTELRSKDPVEIEAKEAAAERAEILQKAEKFEKERLQKERLRNEPKSSAPKQRRIIVSGESAEAYTSPYSDPSKYIKKVAEAKVAASEGAPASNPALPGAGEAQKPA